MRGSSLVPDELGAEATFLGEVKGWPIETHGTSIPRASAL